MKRKLDGGKLEEGCSMAAQGASALVASGRPAEAADLVDMLIKSYDAQKELLDEANVGRLCDVAAVFPATSAPARQGLSRAGSSRARSLAAARGPVASSRRARARALSKSAREGRGGRRAYAPRRP